MIKIEDLSFELFIPEEKLLKRVKELAAAINQDYYGKSPILLAVLNGSFMFMSDICKEINLEAEITFVKLASYSGTKSTGNVNNLLGIGQSLKDREVIVIEDIIDTGKSMRHLLDLIRPEKPASVHIASLLVKPDALQEEIDIRYRGFDIPDLFVVGYGLDYCGKGRNLRQLYQKTEK
ncbi:hypoxanthine phosphoribosyltransferase [Cyclobacterium lianum]|uniref:Hypoxanthine phosphoribosyltransferase n=1 Tax=Cyclobacterium lianum TaxID=388280 RepID=A0A1M7K326_9BACT|nr:hypoxanthine phosphoribosyltransferase [Cyclobacterium lianum]SHM59561.1 hypoxanthine phosphoribosyltransferase [Cyclobacterium lianum]